MAYASAGSAAATASNPASSQSVVTYTAPWPIFGLAWSSHSHAASSSSSSSTGLRRGPSIHSAPSTSSPPQRNDHSAAIPHGSRLAIGSLMEEYSNSIQVLGYIGKRDAAGQPRLSTLATAPHTYPATKIAFQPPSLASSSHSTDRDRSYVSPASKSAKRASWGTAQQRGHIGGTPSPEPQHIMANDEAVDGFPNRELLASTADCLRIWECSRNSDVAPGIPGWETDGLGGSLDDDGTGMGSNGYVGHGHASQGRMRFHLREKSVLAHVSHRHQVVSKYVIGQLTIFPYIANPCFTLQSKSSVSPPAPLTSFSWNQPSPNLIVTSSIDTTCTVWDLPSRTALTQLIAHDREVYDVDWCPGSSDVFASVGADGSVRVFDLRSLEHSTIIYETAGPPPPGSTSRPGTGMSTSSSSRNGSTPGAGGSSGGAAPLLRIAFNPWDANYLATFHSESEMVQILDVRAPGLPILELRGHKAAINGLAWGPPSLPGTSSNTLSTSATPSSSSSSSSSTISKGMISTASEDAQVLVYDLASSTLRSASAQGRRSRNSNSTVRSSPAPGRPHSQSLSHSLSSTSLSSSTGGGGGGGPSGSSSSTIWGGPGGGGSGIPSEMPFLCYDSAEMVNNVAWYRPSIVKDSFPSSSSTSATATLPSTPGSGGGGGGGGTTHGRSTSSSAGLHSVVAEWNEYAANAKGGNVNPARQDWMACVSGRELRCLRVA